MTTLLKKYSLLVIASIATTNLLTAFILSLNPQFLTTQTPDGVTVHYGSSYLKAGIEYLINIIFIIILYLDMKKLKFMSIPVLVLTFFSSLIGVIFLFIINAYDNLTSKN